MCLQNSTHYGEVSFMYLFIYFLPFHCSQLEVSTTDFAGNLVEGPAILVITVIDQNDNRPIFKETHYTGEVLEGSPTGR